MLALMSLAQPMTPAQALHRQLLHEQGDVKAARDNLAESGSLPGGFHEQGMSMLSAIVAARVLTSEAASELREKIQRSTVGWKIAEVDALLSIVVKTITITGGEASPAR